MEPSGRNQSQPVANATASKPAQKRENRCRGLRQSAPNLDGKEGVDGSSPSEGLKYLQISYSRCLPRHEVRM